MSLKIIRIEVDRQAEITEKNKGGSKKKNANKVKW